MNDVVTIDELLQTVTVEELSDPYRRYAEAIGIENLYKLFSIIKGNTINVSSPEVIFKGVIRKRIIEEYKTTKTSERKLAEKYGIAKTTVHKYLQE